MLSRPIYIYILAEILIHVLLLHYFIGLTKYMYLIWKGVNRVNYLECLYIKKEIQLATKLNPFHIYKIQYTFYLFASIVYYLLFHFFF